MGRYRLRVGEMIAAVSAILLFVFMFFDWFAVECFNNSNLLFYVQCSLPGRNAWDTLDYVPGVLLITVFAALIAAALHLTIAPRELPAAVNALVAILGIVSVLLILYRIVEPPIHDVEGTITYQGTARFPVFLALLAAVGVALGGFWAMREEGIREQATADT